MDATIDVVHWTAVMPGDRPIANFTPIYRTAVGAVGDGNREPACSKLLQFPDRRATTKNLDIPGTIPARSIKPYARSYLFIVDFREAVAPECDRRVASVTVNCIARNSHQANRYSRRNRKEVSYFKIYENFSLGSFTYSNLPDKTE